MPSIFKALASITAWIMFVSGCLGVVFAFIYWSQAELTVPTTAITIDFLGAIATLLAGVVVMRLRQKME